MGSADKDPCGDSSRSFSGGSGGGTDGNVLSHGRTARREGGGGLYGEKGGPPIEETLKVLETRKEKSRERLCRRLQGKKTLGGLPATNGKRRSRFSGGKKNRGLEKKCGKSKDKLSKG